MSSCATVPESEYSDSQTINEKLTNEHNVRVLKKKHNGQRLTRSVWVKRAHHRVRAGELRFLTILVPENVANVVQELLITLLVVGTLKVKDEEQQEK